MQMALRILLFVPVYVPMWIILRLLCAAYMSNNPLLKLLKVVLLKPLAALGGRIFNLVGGIQEMRFVFDRLDGVPGSKTLEMLDWDGIGEWRG